MINFDDAKKKKTQARDPKKFQIPDDLYKILIIGGWKSWKNNALLNK